MKRKNRIRKQGIATTLPPLKRSGLQARMTFSYVWVTVICVLLLEILIGLAGLFADFAFQSNDTRIPIVVHTAQQYAAQIASRSTTTRLISPQLGDANESSPSGREINNQTINIPYITQRFDYTQPIAFVLLVTSKGIVVTSSYPARYTIKMPISQALPYAASTIHTTLSGMAGMGKIYKTSTGNYVIGAVEPILVQHHIIAAIYVEIPSYPQFSRATVPRFLKGLGLALFISSIIALLLSAPIGGIFGLVTTRSLVHRIRNLVNATTLFADGNYKQRVPVTRKDEVGQLEQQFNRMAEQLVESITQRQELAEQNARLAERSRISRELHDAISQDLFSLSMMTGGLQIALPQDSSLRPQVATLGTTTTNVIREMRALLLELRPLQIEDLGLSEGLKELAISYSTRLGIIVNAEIATVQLSTKAEHALLRISQEALANAVRHANATDITLSLIPCEQHVTLTISDNGTGFNPDENKIQHGLGLRLMQERVQELNGTFTLQSTPNYGTCIHVCLLQEHACDSSLDCR